MKRWIPLLIVLFLLASNLWPGWEGGIDLLSAADVRETYLPVAEAAPAIPRMQMAPHQAQRFALPFFAGWLSKVTSLPLPWVFWLLVGSMHGGILLLFWRATGRLGATGNRQLLAFGLLTLQPYFLRYYWLAPGMASDVLFEFGTIVLVTSLLSGRMLGIALATLGRQTTLMLLPGAFIYLFLGQGWKKRPAATKFYSICWGGLTFALIFYATWKVAQRFSTGSMPISTMYGLFPWLISDGTYVAFAEHSIRCLLPLLPVLLLLSLEDPRCWTADTWSLILMGAAVASQPFFAGPVLTGQNAARLATLGLIPFVLAWASAGRREWSEKGLVTMLILLALGSFHHLYTSIGTPNAASTAALQLVVALGVAVTAFFERKMQIS